MQFISDLSDFLATLNLLAAPIPPQVVSGTVTGTGVDCNNYHQSTNLLVNIGAVVASGLVSIQAQESADNATNWTNLGTAITATTAQANTQQVGLMLRTLRYLRVVVTLVSGTSVAVAVSFIAMPGSSSGNTGGFSRSPSS